MSCVFLKNFGNQPEIGPGGKTLVSVHEVDPEQAVELDLHPVGLPPYLIIDLTGKNLCAVAGTYEAVKGWAIYNGLEVMQEQ